MYIFLFCASMVRFLDLAINVQQVDVFGKWPQLQFPGPDDVYAPADPIPTIYGTVDNHWQV
jgi:hypothetical protein